MTKRGIIDLGDPVDPKFRVSKTGKDVSSTNIDDFLMHEDFMFTQIMAAGTVGNPGGGADYTTVIDLGFNAEGNVHVEVYFVFSATGYYFPAYPLYSNFIGITVVNVLWSVSGTQLTLDFGGAHVGTIHYVVYKV